MFCVSPPSSSMNQAVANSSRTTPTAEDWERHRLLIKRLYVDEGMKLKEVAAIMASQHGHHATLKMYKDRITKWRLDKKNKQSDMLAILRKKTDRDAVGKQSSFRVRGRPVTIEEVLHYFKRKTSADDEDAYNAPTPSDVSCRTPSPSPASMYPKNDLPATEIASSSWRGEASALVVPSTESISENEQVLQETLEDMCNLMCDDTKIPQSPSTPHTLLVSERLLFTIQTYFDGSFERGSWITDGQHIMVIGAPFEALNAPFAFGNCCAAAVASLENGHLVQFRRLLAKSFSHVEISLRFEHPRTLDRLIEIILWLKRLNRTEIIKVWLRYIVNMATTLYAKNHPWYDIGQLLGMNEEDSIHQVLIESWRCATNSFEKGLGRFHDDSFYNKVVFIERVYSPRDAENYLRRLLLQWEGAETNLANKQIMVILMTLQTSLMYQQRFAEAEQLGLDVVSRAEKQYLSHQMSESFKILACSQFHQNKNELAEKNLRRAIQIASKMWHPANPTMIDLMIHLEGWLHGWGREEEANGLRAEIAAAIGRDETDEEFDGK